MSREPYSIPELWPDSTAVIVAGGPSLDLAQIRHIARARLRSPSALRVFAVNDAVYPCWFGDWLHACDGKWWVWHREMAPRFPGIRTTTDVSVAPAWAHLLRRVPPDKRTGWSGGFGEAPDEICTGGNGGYQTIQIAVKTGAKRVLLLGFDMQRPPHDKPTHWFGDHPDRIRSDYETTMLPYFPTLVEPLRERGVEVINCTPGSAIDCFERAELGAVLD